MKIKFLLSTVLVLTLTLAACAPQAAPTKKAAVPSAIPPVAKSTTLPAATPTTVPTNTSPSTTPTAAPQEQASTPALGPAETNDIVVNDQTAQSGTILVSMVDTLEPGWVAIFTDDNGQPGDVLGYVAVPMGTSEDVKVTLNTKSVPSKMIAMLLTDAGTIGTFEYPGADEPVKNAYVNENVMAVFNRASQ